MRHLTQNWFHDRDLKLAMMWTRDGDDPSIEVILQIETARKGKAEEAPYRGRYTLTISTEVAGWHAAQGERQGELAWRAIEAVYIGRAGKAKRCPPSHTVAAGTSLRSLARPTTERPQIQGCLNRTEGIQDQTPDRERMKKPQTEQLVRGISNNGHPRAPPMRNA